MFTISKNEVAPTVQKQSEQVHSFQYSHPGVLSHQQNYDDFSHGVDELLQARGYHLLPGASDILSSWHNDSDFIIVIRGFMPTSVVYLNELSLYRHFMKEWGPSASVWHLVAPFPKQDPPPNNLTKFDPRRGY